MEPTPSLDVRITTSNDEEWIHLIDSKLSLVRRKPQDLGICRVPDELRAIKPEAYTPQMVSIGPYHRNKPELRAMEEFKWKYTLDFIDGVAETDSGNIQINESHGEANENSPQTLALKKCCKVISELEVEARAFYAEDINLDTYHLVQMFLLDACFILEYMRRTHSLMVTQSSEELESLELLDGQLPIVIALAKDLMLLENQIPYNILQLLFDLIPSSRRITDARELIKSGFRISLHPSRVSIVDIKFREGEIFLPSIVADRFTSPLFRNLIALEQSRNDRQVITSYVVFMRTLLRSREDFYILEQAGIIINFDKLKDMETAFERFHMGVTSADFVFRDLCEEINNYKVPWWSCHRVTGYTTVIWFRWKASVKDLKRDYFKTRWSFLTFIAASFVILLTVAQTFYTIRAYYPPYH
uniref:Uncharacterized protein n=1 Tax=Daucus carota subsp. sativus TaxID=79200 RepID=A0A165AAI6_DAUCS